jgi:hypothetical protein
MSISATKVTLPTVFSDPSTFKITFGLARVRVGMEKLSTRTGDMKLSVAPLSISALTGE